MKTLKITEQLTTEILNYLAKKPWIEVVDLMNRLQQLEKISETNTKETS